MNLPEITAANGVRLVDLSVQDLKRELARAVEITAQHLLFVAAIWRELERRGEDMAAFKSGLWTYMPAIAAGRLRAEIVIKYAGFSTLLTQIAALPLDAQDRLIEDDTVAFVEHKDGEFVETRRSLTSLRATEIKQVIRQRIVPPEDQRRAALGQVEAEKKGGTMKDRTLARAARERKMRFEVNYQTGIPLTSAEQVSLKAAARAHGVPISRLVRAALVTAGLLDD